MRTIVLGLGCAAAATAHADGGPPRAPARPVSDTYFGATVVDDYRWMETPESPELVGWMVAQDAHTRGVLAAIPERDELRARLRELAGAVDKVGAVRLAGKWVFYEKRLKNDDVFALYVREGLAGRERLLYHPGTERKGDVHVALDAAVPSPDGRHIAIGTSTAGSEEGMIRVIDVASGDFTADRVDRVNFAVGGVPSWIDDRRFAVLRLQQLAAGAPQSERYKNTREVLHTLGGDAEDAPALTGKGLNPALPFEGDDMWASTSVIRGEPHAFAIVGRGTDKHIAVYTAPLAKLGPAATIPWRKLFGFEARATDFTARGRDLYVLTHRDAPRYKLLRTSLASPDLATAETVLPEGGLVLRSLAGARDALYVLATERGLGRLVRVPWRGRSVEHLALPVEGAVWLAFADPRRDGLLVELESWLVPRAIYRYDPQRHRLIDTGLQPKDAVDVSRFTSVEVEATGEDGTRVPLSIIRRADAPKDGSQPLWLDGYGGYGLSYDPRWDARNLAWLERGALAVCHVRGGGELGDSWHEQGRLANKPNTWKDFIACAKYLVEHGYTSAKKLVGTGTSMGGVMIGNAIIDRPDLFAAAVIRVGVSNPLRMEATANIFQVPEIGSVSSKEGFDMLRAMDAYGRVRDGVAYPAVLLTTGLTDPRVVPWQVTKMAARLQAATRGPRPILLRVEQHGGHGIGSTVPQMIEELADLWSFAIAQTR